MKKIKYIIFSLLEAFFSVAIIILIGFITKYHANDHSILLNIIVWSIPVIIAYILVSALYYFLKIRMRHIYFFEIASGYFGMIIGCLLFAKNLDEYNFLDVFGFMVGIFSLVDILIMKDYKNRERNLENRVPIEIYDKISDLSINKKEIIIKIIDRFLDVDSFKLIDACSITKLSEKSTRNLLKYAEEKQLICSSGQTSSKIYYVNVNKLKEVKYEKCKCEKL